MRSLHLCSSPLLLPPFRFPILETIKRGKWCSQFSFALLTALFMLRFILPTFSLVSDSFSSVYVCEDCGRFYKYKKTLISHKRFECGKEAQFGCPEEGCFYKAKTRGNLKKHIINKHKIMIRTRRYRVQRSWNSNWFYWNCRCYLWK